MLKVSTIDLARSFKRLLDVHHDMTPADLASRIGKPKAWVERCLTLLNLHPEAETAVRNGSIGGENAFVLARLNHQDQLVALCDSVIMPPETFAAVWGGPTCP
jgi:hypothetical protein